jgi:hypothetical protein
MGIGTAFVLLGLRHHKVLPSVTAGPLHDVASVRPSPKTMTDGLKDDDIDESTGSGSLDQYRGLTDEEKLAGVEPYHKEEYLRGLYCDEGFTLAEIAESYSDEDSQVSKATVSRWMDEHGIETRPPMHLRSPSVSKTVREDGYVQFFIPDGDGGRASLYRHQLVALLATEEGDSWAFSASEVFGDSTQIHHEMASSIALDVPVNLDVVGRREHAHIHAGVGVAGESVEEILSLMREWPSENGVEITFENYRDTGSVDMEDSGEDAEVSTGVVGE